MVFVYKGAGKKQRKDADDCQKDVVCQKIACDIQKCLAKSNYQEKYCRHIFVSWQDCCKRVRKLKLKKQVIHSKS